MQQRFLLQIFLLAQHVSGTTMPIIRSSRVLYSSCYLWHLVLWFSSCWSGVELRVICPASNKICNKKPLLHLLGILFPHINDDARSKSHQIYIEKNCASSWSFTKNHNKMHGQQNIKINTVHSVNTTRCFTYPGEFRGYDILISVSFRYEVRIQR